MSGSSGRNAAEENPPTDTLQHHTDEHGGENDWPCHQATFGSSAIMAWKLSRQ